MIYFDNAATTYFKPQEVLDAYLTGATKYSVNPNRSFNNLTARLSELILNTRKKAALKVNCKNPLNVVFGLNCTDALNLAILGSVKKRGEHVVTSVLEHNSVLRPLCRLKQRGFIDLTILTPDKNMLVSAEILSKAITPKTTCVVLSHVSNVTGATQNLKEIGEVCKNNDIKFIVDAAQSMGYLPIDMTDANINMVAFPAHKGLHSTVGCGVLCFDDNSKPAPIRYGGTGTQSHLLSQPTDSPEAYESGTLNSPAILALNAAFDWHEANKTKFLNQTQLVQNTIAEGLADIKNVKIYSVQNQSGIITFNIGESDSNAICDILAQNYGIYLRGGLHCSPLCHKYLGTTNTGLVRVSVSGNNTLSQAYIFLNAVQQIAKKM